MKVLTRGSGNTGQQPYTSGQELDERSEFVNRMLVNRVFLPLDDEAQQFVDNPDRYSHLSTPALATLAGELDESEE